MKPSPTESCGPYSRDREAAAAATRTRPASWASAQAHDTIGMVAIDSRGRMAAGTSTNGAANKIPGYVETQHHPAKRTKNAYPLVFSVIAVLSCWCCHVDGCVVRVETRAGVGQSLPCWVESEAELESVKFCQLRHWPRVARYHTSTDHERFCPSSRVGDSPVAGAGAYVDGAVGGAAATGDGDVMMRFLPSFFAVEAMRGGAEPAEACRAALARIVARHPEFVGALVALTRDGRHGAACHGLDSFPYSVAGGGHGVRVIQVPCDGDSGTP